MNLYFAVTRSDNRPRIAQQIAALPDGIAIVCREEAKSRDQECRYHAMIGDISKQCKFMEQEHSLDDWKRLLVDLFAKQKAILGEPIKQQGRIVPALDGQGFVQLGLQTRDFSKREGSDFIEFLYMYGATQKKPVVWSE